MTYDKDSASGNNCHATENRESGGKDAELAMMPNFTLDRLTGSEQFVLRSLISRITL